MQTLKTWGYLTILLAGGTLCGQQGQIQIPSRPPSALFQGEQGKQKPEIQFDPATGMVTVKMLVQDPNGYFIPNIRRDNFAVYENEVKQQNATVEIEHAPVTLGLLMEWGGRYQSFNKTLVEESSRAAHQLLDEIGRQDEVAIWKYADRTTQLADFSTTHETLDGLFLNRTPPEFSEVNLYDALAATLQQMKPAAGRKAMVLVTTGVDTFSKISYEDLLNQVREAGVAVYVIDIGPIVRASVERTSFTVLSSRIAWNRAESELKEIARLSGGRLYSPGSTFDLSGVYDDMMENLRVRYVIAYKSSSTSDLNAPRSVRVELINPKTGGPLEIVDAHAQPVTSKIFVQESYVPRTAAAPVPEVKASERGKSRQTKRSAPPNL